MLRQASGGGEESPSSAAAALLGICMLSQQPSVFDARMTGLLVPQTCKRARRTAARDGLLVGSIKPSNSRSALRLYRTMNLKV